MSIGKLHLPALDINDSSELATRPKALKAWLDGLPLGDMQASGYQIITTLNEYNRCKLPAATRLESLNIFGRVVQDLTSGLSASYRDSSFPLSERNRLRYKMVSDLCEEMANGFKRLANDYYEDWDHGPSVNKQFYDVVRIAIVYLSKQMVAAYTTYSLEPKGVWQDLHNLYKLVETISHTKPSDDGIASKKYNPDLESTLNSYLRIAMLSITNPYHLMQGEAQLIYNYLNKWVDGCRIVHMHGYIVDKGDLIIDLDHDIPPHFVYKDHTDQPKNCRSIDMSQLMSKFKETIAALTTRKESAGGIVNSNLTFNERIRRDMLLRLQSVWDSRAERGAPRKTADEKLRLVSSLSACHYFIDEQKEFFPESDEVRIHKPERNVDSSVGGLSLLPVDYEPWKEEQERHHADADLESKRLSLFNEDLDIWEKIYASKSHARALHEVHSVKYKDHLWQQLNVSHNGMGVRYEAAENARVSVGNIVAYHPADNPEQWGIGVVTWVKEFDVSHLDLGIKIMPGVARPVAARAISGAGCGSEYFRSLLFDTENSGEKVTRIIVPASMYDLGTQLVLNFRTELAYVRLVSVISTTSCYTIFGFNQIEIPMIERHKIDEMKSA